MASYTQISPNMWIEEDSCFGNYSKAVVYGLMRSVDDFFSDTLELTPFSSTPCIVSYNHTLDVPMCCHNGDFHHIYLRCTGDYWCQWVFQFAHEYCHHLIGGKMSGEISGLIWFEESVCELSSMYHLQNLGHLREHIPEALPRRYAPSFLDYLENRISCGAEYYSEISHQGFLRKWGSHLQEPKYDRKMYSAIASQMLPLFLENPHLWKIILHFGDMRRWHSLDELFLNLRNHATQDYSDSLEKLRFLLLS